MTVKVWNADAPPEAEERAGHRDAVSSVAFAPDGSSLVTASYDRTLRIWDLPDMTERAVLEGHGEHVMACAVSPDGRFILSGSIDGTLKVWDPNGGPALGSAPAGAEVTSCAIAPDGSFVAAGLAGIQVWDPGGTVKGAISNIPAPMAVAVSPDGSVLAAACVDGSVRVWDVDGYRERWTASGHEGPAAACAFSPDGRSLVSGGIDRVAKLWDLAGGGRRNLHGHGGWVMDCTFTPDGARILSAGADTTVRVWDPATGRAEGAAALPSDLGCLRAHPTIPLVACGGGGGALYLLDLVGYEYGPVPGPAPSMAPPRETADRGLLKPAPAEPGPPGSLLKRPPSE